MSEEDVDVQALLDSINANFDEKNVSSSSLKPAIFRMNLLNPLNKKKSKASNFIKNQVPHWKKS